MSWKAFLQNLISTLATAALSLLAAKLTGNPVVGIGTGAVAAGVAHALPSPYKQ